MAHRLPQIAENEAGCTDWVPSPELQLHLRSLPKPKRPDDNEKLLQGIIEADVIPRLLLANPPEFAIASPPDDRVAATLAARVGEFSELVINDDERVSIAFVQRLRQDGVSLEALFQDLLAPTARRLGLLWEEDINDFLDVTRGMGRLQQIVRAFSEDFGEEARKPSSGKRVLLTPIPGEQHTFGLSLLREHFLREGWRVWAGPIGSVSDIVSLAKTQWFDIIGLSASALDAPGELAALIAQIRKASPNKKARIFVGGRIFDLAPQLVDEVGADATAKNGREAVLLLKSI